jgi:exopolysaccharide biosynthesis polyprenyl glycosylphosphotransferase
MPRLLHNLTRVLDLLTVLAAVLGGLVIAGNAPGWSATASAAIHLALWGIISTRVGAYLVAANQNLRYALGRMFETWAATWGVAGLLSATAGWGSASSAWWTLLFGTIGLALVRMGIAASPWGSATMRPRAVVIGSCPSARSVSNSRAAGGMDLVGLVPFTNEDDAAMPHLRPLGQLRDLADIVRKHEVDVAIISPSDVAITGEVRNAVRACSDLGVGVRYFPSFLDVEPLRVSLTWDSDRPGLHLRAATAPTAALAAKRVLDIAGAALGIILSLPVFVLSAIAIKLTSRGPIFFKQERVGMGGRHFTCLKFRTMRRGAHAQQELLRSSSSQDGPAFKMPEDPRVTAVGRLLRKFSVDELPQLLNVLAGDMSLVGPRPPIPSEVEKYAWWQRRRVSVRPGLTCLWQVYGRNTVSFKRWVEMDLYYIDNWSLWLDLKLIVHTFRVVLRGTGM